MKCFIVNLFFQLVLTAGFGRNQGLSGIIKDVENNPVIYANVGIMNHSTGTVADLDGTFRLSLAKEHYSDT